MSSYISDANFLFVTLETKYSYNLYQFDLEQLDESIKHDGVIKSPQWIFGYLKDEVKEMIAEKMGVDDQVVPPLLGIHVRAPNTRLKIKVNNKLIVLFHH